MVDNNTPDKPSITPPQGRWFSLPTTYYRLPSRFPRLTILLCSLLWALCYPPFPLGLLGFAVLAPAFLATAALTPGRAFRAWFAGGIAYNTVMYWWIWNVMKVGPAFAVGAGLVLLIAYLSLFNGLLGWGFSLALRAPAARRRTLLALYPIAWAGLEAARAVGEMSFPWNNLGYVLGNFPVLFQSVSLWGIYGLSAAMIAANLFLYLALEKKSGRGARWCAAFALVPLLLWGAGTLVLARSDDSKAPRMDISLVQPSIPQTNKWDEDYFWEVMGKTYRTMIGKDGDLSAVRGSDLIVLAETAVPDFLRARPTVADSLRAVAASTGSSLLVGALDIVADRRPWSEYRFYNSAFLFVPRVPGAARARNAEGDSTRPAPPAQYSKLRLVPFSEKLPFDGLFPVLNYVNLGEGDFSAGDGHRVWGRGETRWAPSICYEVIYPAFAREARAGGARLLVNITNDGWFGRSNGPYQHANIARFRAAENGMPVARGANNGVSVFYDAWGRDLGRTALMDSTVLRRAVPMPDRRTVYARAGGLLDGLFLLSLGLWALLAASPLLRGIPPLRAWRARRGRSTLDP